MEAEVLWHHHLKGMQNKTFLPHEIFTLLQTGGATDHVGGCKPNTCWKVFTKFFGVLHILMVLPDILGSREDTLSLLCAE